VQAYQKKVSVEYACIYQILEQFVQQFSSGKEKSFHHFCIGHIALFFISLSFQLQQQQNTIRG
jgi:hypothetical protein